MADSEENFIEQGYKKYYGDEIDIYFHPTKCTHAANCIKYLPSVFNVNHKPWIYPNGALREDGKRVVHNCPSDALKFIDKRNVH
ncbi:(4Fe-4S)-binding protein [Psychrobacillus psychrodurans]|uniref:(4Fe-4S)-binding protein n=1 Tax=Psychrobacillus TaxID=1221880 RepID=UPI0008F2D1BA|nr:(4Fe-4S)-binding protein [Psychrobacillus psychrodurans]MCZ8539857.1 (4Fe-4S)-binding protein [Psychrobacillus psychrodurans]SFM55703.1 Uncharacterized Fe-S cluster protein YjdI [Psychrobacillus psychrodurans]